MSYRSRIDGLDGMARSLEKALARDVTAGVREGVEALKNEAREETRVGLPGGNRLAMSWRGKVYPSGVDSVDASGWVFVRRDRRGDVAAKVIGLATTGGIIRANRGKWLAVPTREAGRFGLKAGATGFGTTTNSRGARERITPAGFERRSGMKLRFVPGANGRAFLVADRAMLRRGIAVPYESKGRGSRLYGPSGQSFIAFVLVKFTRAKKRIDLEGVANRGGSMTADLIAKYGRD